jgi:anti-sigma factor RsiW
MLRCWIARRNLTAWLDGELSESRARHIRHHLSCCGACSVEAEHLGAAVTWQRHTLPQLFRTEDVDTGALRRALHTALAAERSPSIPLFRPVVVAGAAVMVGLILLLLSVAGGPNAVLIPLGVKSPPLAVTREPDLFENYQLIQRLDALENFDTVESEPLDNDQTPHHG